MADTRDPVDHYRTVHQHAGEPFIDVYCWPGIMSIALGVMSLIACVATAAYHHSEWMFTTGIVGAMSLAGGTAWLVIEHHRVLRIEQRWHLEQTTAQATLYQLPFRP